MGFFSGLYFRTTVRFLVRIWIYREVSGRGGSLFSFNSKHHWLPISLFFWFQWPEKNMSDYSSENFTEPKTDNCQTSLNYCQTNKLFYLSHSKLTKTKQSISHKLPNHKHTLLLSIIMCQMTDTTPQLSLLLARSRMSAGPSQDKRQNAAWDNSFSKKKPIKLTKSRDSLLAMLQESRRKSPSITASNIQ